jgi:CelD/BcsL family acetyltransferase involved in cellulose biosynthesis
VEYSELLVNTAPASADLRVEVVTTLAGLQALAPDWNCVLAKSVGNNVFLTWEWISTWWDVYGAGSQLHVVVVREAHGRIVGLAPLRRIRRNRVSGDTVTLIGSGGDVTPEYLDFLVEAGWEERVVPLVIYTLLDEPRIQEIDLQPLGDSPTTAILAERLASHSGRVRELPGSSCPYMTLPASAELFRQSRSKNYRKKMREFEQRCEVALQARLRLTTAASELKRDMETLKQLHIARWNGSSRAFRSREYLDFHDRFARLALERDWLRLYSLESGDRTLAMLYCFVYGQRYYFYQSGRDLQFNRDRVGLVLMHKVILEAIREGATIFDFLSGDEPYKFRWATGVTNGRRIQYWKSATGWAISSWRQQLANISQVPSKILRRSRT